jgi:signal transduction histidine kinase
MKKILTVCLFVFIAGAVSAQYKQIVDSLEKQLPSLAGKEKFFALSDISFYAGFYDVKKSGNTGKSALSFSFDMKDSALVAEAYNGMAIYYFRIGELDSSLDYNYKALILRRKLGDKSGMISSHSKIGNIYAEQARYDEALNNLQKALKLAEEINDYPKTAALQNSLASLHVKLKNNEKIKYYALECIRLSSEAGDEYTLAMAHGNMGVYYQNIGNADSSIVYFEKSLKIMMAYGSYMDASIAENNLGVSYRMKGETEKGLQHYLKAYELSKKLDDKAGMALYGANVGGVYNSLGKYDQGKKFFEESLELARDNHLKKIMAQCYDGISTSYFGKGNLEDALKYKDDYLKMRDSILGEEKIKQLAEAETKFLAERKEKEALIAKANLAIEKEERALLQTKSEARKKWVIGITGVAIIIILLISIYFIRKRQQEKLLYDAEIIRQRELGLKSVIHATEEERKRIARELHDGIGQSLGGLKLTLQNFGNEFARENDPQKNKLLEITKILDDAATEVRSISHQMMPRVLSELGLAPAIEDMLRKTFSGTSIKYSFDTYGITERLDDTIEVSLYRICQELTNNIIKHAGATEVSVQLFKNKNHIILIVEDNGKGFDFHVKKEGIGLLNINSRLNIISGDVNYEPSPESGTIATIRIPLKQNHNILSASLN